MRSELVVLAATDKFVESIRMKEVTVRPTFRFLAVVLMGLTLAHGQQPAQNLMPPAAQEILGRMDKEIVIAKTKAITALDKVLKDTTKKSDLQGAIAVKEAIDRLQGEIRAGGRPGGASAFVGRWKGQGWTSEVFPDGTVRLGDGTKGRWMENGNTVIVEFENGITHEVQRTPDGFTGVYKHGGKAGGNVKYTAEGAAP